MNRFIIADATKCIGCRTCEVACAVSHQENQDCAALSPDEFISRIRVIKDHSWTTAVACHQCEDAPCANVCPVDAISREHGHIFVEQTRCIGCKSCMLACPFGAMEVVSSRKKARAIKCDLCWHRETGPACVEACPTKALQCMDVEKVQRHRLRQQPVSALCLCQMRRKRLIRPTNSSKFNILQKSCRPDKRSASGNF